MCECKRERRKELKARVEVKLCELPELNEDCFSQSWSKVPHSDNILRISKDDFEFPKSYETTSDDCSMIDCGKINTAALGGIIGVAAVLFAVVSVALFFYFRRKAADSEASHQPGHPTNKHAMNRYEYS